MNHPSELKLERHLLDPQRSGLQEHVAGCARCQSRLQEMQKEGDDFRRFVYPATLDAVAAPRRPLWRGLWVAVPAIGLAAVVLMVRRGPGEEYVGTKGAPLAIAIYAAGATAPLADGDRVPASASLRFRVRAAKPCALSIVSVDESGQVSKLYSQPIRGDATLPGGVKLDGKAGPERFFAVCSSDIDAIEQAARKVSGNLRDARALPGSFGPQASVLLEKGP
jgi:hypothetical protein